MWVRGSTTSDEVRLRRLHRLLVVGDGAVGGADLSRPDQLGLLPLLGGVQDGADHLSCSHLRWARGLIRLCSTRALTERA